jgi:hypothetical protein
LLGSAIALKPFAPQIRAKALAHYSKASELTPGADRDIFQQRAERQTRETLEFVPRYLGLAALQGFVLSGLLWAIRRRRIGDDAGRSVLLGLTMIDLIAFGFGLNPAIDRADDRPVPAVVARLQREVGDSGRIIGLGTEFPPNSLMRYGLADARNYDSVELRRNLKWLSPLYDPKVTEQTSRREITWERVLQARFRLYEASVKAVVGPTPPPAHGFDRVEKVGAVWVAWLGAADIVEVIGPEVSLFESSHEDGRMVAQVESRDEANLIFRETFDPGWYASIDDQPVTVQVHDGTFLAVRVPPGEHRVVFNYDPIEVRIGLIGSVIGAFLTVFGLTGFAIFRFTRIVLQRLGRTQALGLESDS